MRNYKHIKNRVLYTAICKKYGSVRQFCIINALSYQSVHRYISNKSSIFNGHYKDNSRLSGVPIKICDILGIRPDVLFEKDFRQVEKRKVGWGCKERNIEGYAPSSLELYEEKEQSKKIKYILENKLTPKEEQIIKGYIWEGKTLKELGEEFDVNKERIRQVKKRALEKIKRALKKKGGKMKKWYDETGALYEVRHCVFVSLEECMVYYCREEEVGDIGKGEEKLGLSEVEGGEYTRYCVILEEKEI